MHGDVGINGQVRLGLARRLVMSPHRRLRLSLTRLSMDLSDLCSFGLASRPQRWMFDQYNVVDDRCHR